MHFVREMNSFEEKLQKMMYDVHSKVYRVAGSRARLFSEGLFRADVRVECVIHS